jgi:hypothetical protein
MEISLLTILEEGGRKFKRSNAAIKTESINNPLFALQ